jgi:hypothetical protein
MALVSTIGDVRKFLTAASRVKPHYEPHRNIVTPYRAPFTTFVGGKLIGQNKMGADTTLKEVKGLIPSERTNQLKNRNQDFGVFPYQFTSNAAKAGIVAGTPFTHVFANTDSIQPGDLLKNTVTGVVYYVSVKSGTTLTLNIQAGGTDDIGATDRFIRLANARADFWTFGTGNSVEPEEYYNLCQTMSHEVGIGLIAMQQEVFPKGSGKEEDRILTLEAHTVGREFVAIDGVRAIGTQGTDTVYSADGIRSMAEIVVDVGGSLSYEGFRKDVETRVTKPGPDTTWMSGTLVKSNAAMWNLEKTQTKMEDDIYGTNVETIQGLYRHKFHTTEPMENYPGESVCFKKENLKRYYLGVLDTLFLEQVQASNAAGEVDSYVTSECYLRTDEDALTRVIGWNG